MIQNDNDRWEYVGDGVSTAFPYDNVIFAAAYVDVYVSGVLKTLAVEYNVSGGPDYLAGNINFVTPPAAAAAVIIQRNVRNLQPTGFPIGNDFPSKAVEKAFDRACVEVQQVGAKIKRSLQLAPEISGVNDLLLTALEPSKFLRVNATGDGIELATVALSGNVVSASTVQEGIIQLTDDATALAGVNANRAIVPTTLKTVLQGATYDTGQVSTTAGAAEGPTNELYRNINGVAANLGGARSWAMKSATGTKRVVAKVLSRLVTATNGAEAAALDFYTILAGALARRFSLGAGLYANGLADMGAGTGNFTGVYVNGGSVGGKKYSASYTANADLATAIPLDDSQPTNTEGTQVISIANVATTSATQKVRVGLTAPAASAADKTPIAAVYRDGVCIKVFVGSSLSGFGAANVLSSIAGEFDDAPGAAGTYTYSLRVGQSTGTMRLNGTLTGRLFGGFASTDLTLEVFEP